MSCCTSLLATRSSTPASAVRRPNTPPSATSCLASPSAPASRTTPAATTCAPTSLGPPSTRHRAGSDLVVEVLERLAATGRRAAHPPACRDLPPDATCRQRTPARRSSEQPARSAHHLAHFRLSERPVTTWCTRGTSPDPDRCRSAPCQLLSAAEGPSRPPPALPRPHATGRRRRPAWC